MVRGDGGLSQPLAADPVDRHVYPDRSTTDRQHICLLWLFGPPCIRQSADYFRTLGVGMFPGAVPRSGPQIVETSWLCTVICRRHTWGGVEEQAKLIQSAMLARLGRLSMAVLIKPADSGSLRYIIAWPTEPGHHGSIIWQCIREWEHSTAVRRKACMSLSVMRCSGRTLHTNMERRTQQEPNQR